MKFDHFIWDFDGTLFDSYDAITRAFFRATQELHIPINFEELRQLVKHSLGHAARELAARHGLNARDILDAYRRYEPLEETLDTLKPYPGTGELLRLICAKGGSNYLYTHRDLLSMRAIAHHGLGDCIQGAVTREDQFQRKPEPDALLHLIAQHGLLPGRCIMIGDRVLDVEAGINAGIAAALFDPEHFCWGEAPTKLQFSSMEEIRQALVERD